MGFFGAYGTARDTFDKLGDQAGVRARQELSDRNAAAGRLEQMKQLEILRNMPQVEEVGPFEDQPKAAPATPAAPAQQGPAPTVMQDRLTQLRADDTSRASGLNDSSQAELQRLAGAGGASGPKGIGNYNQPDSATTYKAALSNIEAARRAGKKPDPKDVEVASRGPAGGAGAAGGNPQTTYAARLAELQANNRPPLPNQSQAEAGRLANAGGGQTAQGGAQKFAEAIFAQESTSGKANTSAINSSGVTGPMQMKQATFMGAVKMGLVPGITPANANWQDPQQNTAVGKAYAAYLFNKYNGDVHKAAAAYFAGEPAVDSGKINLAGTDATGKTIGGYAQDIMRRMGQAATSVIPSANAAEAVPGQAAAPAAQPQSTANQAQIEQAIQYRINQARAQMQQLQQLAQVTRSPAEVLKMQGQYMELNNSIREQQLFSAYTKGQITPEQYRLASLQEQQRAAAENAKLREHIAAAQGKIYEAAGTAPYKMQEIEAQGLMQIQKSLAEYGMKVDDIKGVTPARDGNPALMHTSRGVFVLQQSAPTKFGPGTLQMIPVPTAPQSGVMGTPGQVQQLQP